MYKQFKKLQFIKKPQFAESIQSTDSFDDSEYESYNDQKAEGEVGEYQTEQEDFCSGNSVLCTKCNKDHDCCPSVNQVVASAYGNTGTEFDTKF